MGNLTSEQIGLMAKAGALGGEMVKRMIQQQEHQMVEEQRQKENPPINPMQ